MYGSVALVDRSEYPALVPLKCRMGVFITPKSSNSHWGEVGKMH
jgi:hypothetical protein